MALNEELKALIQDLSQIGDSLADGGIDDGKKFAILSKASQIQAAIADPREHAYVESGHMIEAVAIRTLIHINAFRHIPKEGSISLSELAKATDTQDSLLERLLRVEVCTGLINQGADRNYSHTKQSVLYADPLGPAAFFQLMYDQGLMVIGRLPGYLDEKGRKESPNNSHCVYSWAHGLDGTPHWQVMTRSPERLAVFQTAMTALDASVPSVGAFDFGQLNTEGDRTILVDVGGGAGHSIVEILTKFPQLPPSKFILQDLKPVIDLNSNSGILPQGVVTMAHDFNTEQPVKGAKAYYLRRVIHDYNDETGIQILKHLANACAPDSRVLIADAIMAERPTAADLPGAVMDVFMLEIAGKERTESQFRAQLKEAGLELYKIWTVPGFIGGIVEARLPK